MGRVISPNDVFFNFAPWANVRPEGIVHAQNSLLNDPPTAYFTLMSLARDDWRAFHWNPYVACGIPGFGSSAAAILSPFILIPALLVPPAWIYTLIVFLKINAAFFFAYLWLREEGLGKRGAAIGAIVVAGAGVYAVRWLWQITNATALYPALLWIACRTVKGKRNSIALLTLVALAYALAGFPAAMAYGAYLVVAYVVVRFRPRRTFVQPAVAVLLALLIASPTLVPFVQLLRRSGYLEMRKDISAQAIYPKEHWRAFLQPDHLGNPAYKDWTGDKLLGVSNNYVESTVYLGLLTIPLALFGVLNRRARMRWFWLGVALLVLACMFGFAPFMARLPGFKYSALARAGLLLPLPIGYLAAAARLRKRWLYDAMALLIALDLAILAGRFLPYLEPSMAVPPQTPMTRFLRAQQRPFRIAPMFNYLWPNSAELVRVEDVRSHFGSEAQYRKLLQRLDPTAWGGASTVLSFNSLQFQFNDPLASLLGIRWFIEHKEIDVIKWGIFAATVPGVKETGSIPLRGNSFFQRTVRIEAEPFWAIELPVNIEGGRGRLDVTLIKNGAIVWSRAFTKDDAVLNKVYIPLRPFARYGESVTLRVQSRGLTGHMLEGVTNPGESPLFYGRVMTPVIFDRELPDGRLFRNLAELPRFRAVTKLRKLNDEEFLAAKDVDFEREAVITDDPVMPPHIADTDAHVTLTKYTPDEQRVVTQSSGAFYLASSEKLTPELAITIDGLNARPIETDSVFAGVPVPAGNHEVVFTRRIGRGWWWVSAFACAVWVLIAAWEVWRRVKRIEN